jgi:hypothetical protein
MGMATQTVGKAAFKIATKSSSTIQYLWNRRGISVVAEPLIGLVLVCVMFLFLIMVLLCLIVGALIDPFLPVSAEDRRNHAVKMLEEGLEIDIVSGKVLD